MINLFYTWAIKPYLKWHKLGVCRFLGIFTSLGFRRSAFTFQEEISEQGRSFLFDFLLLFLLLTLLLLSQSFFFVLLAFFLFLLAFLFVFSFSLFFFLSTFLFFDLSFLPSFFIFLTFFSAISTIVEWNSQAKLKKRGFSVLKSS